MAQRHSEPPPPLSLEAAAAFREANVEFRAAIDEEAAFADLSRRLVTRETRARLARWAMPAFAATAMAAFAALRPAQPAGTIAPELLASAERPRPPSPVTWAPEPSTERARTARAAPLPSSPRRAPAAPPANEARPTAAASAPRVASVTRHPAAPEQAEGRDAGAEPAIGPDCLRLARQGATREAEACFGARARGAGLGAEMALYELSRLRRDVLGDAQGALAALDDYGARFPLGSLRREVDMSYLELLVQLGRNREALTRSQTLLQSQSGRERAAELHLLRGDVFRRGLQDLRAAEREYGEAEQLAGSVEAEATYLRGVCLEALGEPAAARAAFQRYLSKPSRPRASEVVRRLERLPSP